MSTSVSQPIQDQVLTSSIAPQVASAVLTTKSAVLILKLAVSKVMVLMAAAVINLLIAVMMGLILAAQWAMYVIFSCLIMCASVENFSY